jgi:hypothetical protein
MIDGWYGGVAYLAMGGGTINLGPTRSINIINGRY